MMGVWVGCITLLFLSGVFGGCEVYDNSLSTSSLCASFVSSQVYVPSNTTQIVLNELLLQSKTYQLLTKLISILPLSCYKSTASIICQSSFPTCSRDTSSNSTFPVYPCLSACENNLESCGDIWSSVNVTTAVNCTGNTALLNNNAWPIENCNSNIFPPNVVRAYSNPPVTTCPSVYRLHSRINSENEAPCSVMCPDPSYTLHEFNEIAEVNIILAVISLLLLIYVIGGYILDPIKRQFPARLHLWLLFSIFGFQIGTFMSGRRPAYTTMCVDDTTYSTQDNNATCATQGFFLIYFSIAAALWLIFQSGVTFVCIVLEMRPKFLKRYEKYFHIIVWGLSLIFMIVILATHSIDYSYSTRIYCFLSVRIWDGHTISVDYPLYYIPMTGFFCVIFVFFIAALVKLVLYGVQNKQLASKNYVRAQLRILIVIALMIILFSTIFSFRYNNSATDYKRQRNINRAQWLNCRIRSELLFDSIYPPECDTSVNPYRTGYSAKMFQNVGLALLGAFVFLGFGTDAGIYRQWVNTVQLLYRRDMNGFWRLLKTSSDISSGGSGKRMSELSREKTASV